MLGAIIGDLAGSRFEWNSTKSKDFELLNYKCSLTDSGILTLAVAQAVLNAENKEALPRSVSDSFQAFARYYPHAGFSESFARSISACSPAPATPCDDVASWVSPIAYAATSLDEVRYLTSLVSAVTHSHPDACKGAEAVTVAIYLAQTGSTLPEIRAALKAYYSLDSDLAALRESPCTDGICLGSVPLALTAFLESACFEDAIRNAVSLGTDSAVISAITGSLAEAYYGIPSDLRNRVITFLDSRQHAVISSFERRYGVIYEKNPISAPVSSVKILPEAALAGGIGVIETERPVSILSAFFTEPDQMVENPPRPSRKPVKRKTKSGKRPRKAEKTSKNESAEMPVLL